MLQLTITLDQATGKVNLRGPLGNKLLCLGLLEEAKAALHEHYQQQAQAPKIELAPAGAQVLPAARGR